MSETERIDTLKALQKRIREATGPDRYLDALVHRAFTGPGTHPCDIPRYTTDPDGLGACVALMREVLPGREWSRDRSGDFCVLGEVSSGIWGVEESANCLANDCLTFLDAIISATISELEARQQETA